MRILLVSPGNNQKYGGGFYYSFHRRLMNGFIRNGHFVYPFSDRDTADYALGVRRFGKWMANKRLVEIASELQPRLLVLLQCHLIEPETVQQVRENVPGVKVAAISIDDISHPTPAGQFRHLLQNADFGFATTGGETLRAMAGDKPLAFIPNPVDLSIDTERTFEAVEHEFDMIFAGHQPMVDVRWGLIEELRRRLPDDMRIGLFGKRQERQLSGARYVTALGRTKIGLNLNRRDGDLYASDRMAQLIGNGLLLATHRASGYGEIFGEDEMLFFDGVEDLAESIKQVLGGDDAWREMAEKGWERAKVTMNERLVAKFILGIANGDSLPADWVFGDHVFNSSDKGYARVPAA
ncbi:MAG: glycosyltransferase [Alphaproteobacteria bacterium]|nr:glycosyltransferase [Alphaproteobacteria bacterium]